MGIEEKIELRTSTGIEPYPTLSYQYGTYYVFTNAFFLLRL